MADGRRASAIAGDVVVDPRTAVRRSLLSVRPLHILNLGRLPALPLNDEKEKKKRRVRSAAAGSSVSWTPRSRPRKRNTALEIGMQTLPEGFRRSPWPDLLRASFSGKMRSVQRYGADREREKTSTFLSIPLQRPFRAVGRAVCARLHLRR